MRVTMLGHAGLFLETTGGSILCDPWFTPAYFTSWFPFPRNDALDPAPFARPDYLYVSHAHRDHLDVEWLDRNVHRDATVLLPAFDIDQLERELHAIGFERFVHTHDRVPVDLGGGLRVAILSLAAPNVGPMGDSTLVVSDPTATVLDQNDAHPADLGVLDEFGACHVHLLQYSGAIWYPMVYDIPDEEERRLITDKRRRQTERAVEYVKMAGAAHVVPMAGPPCFLDEELYGLNDVPGRETIFPDASGFCDELAARGASSHLTVPGTVLDVDGDEVTVTHPVPLAEVRSVFDDKEDHLRRYQADVAEVIATAKASWPDPRPGLTAELAAWFEPLLDAAPALRAAIGAPVEIDASPAARIVIDMASGRVRDWQPGDDPPYGFRVDPRLLTAEIDRREPDWCNHLFLSCRFEARRRGGYNDWLYTFFKSLSPERIAYTEAFVRARTEGGVPADLQWIELDGWVVQSRCPHQGASLARMGSVNDHVLTCGLHGWQFDLRTGECLNGEGVSLLVRGRAGQAVELDSDGI